MFIGVCTLYMKAEWVNSLKEKRMTVKSIIEKSKHRFNISIAEVDMQDVHKTIVIGFACVSNEKAHAERMVNTVIDYIENNCDAVIYDTETEIL